MDRPHVLLSVLYLQVPKVGKVGVESHPMVGSFLQLFLEPLLVMSGQGLST